MSHYSESVPAYVERLVKLHLSQGNPDKARSILNSSYRRKLDQSDIIHIEEIIADYFNIEAQKKVKVTRAKFFSALEIFEFERAESLMASLPLGEAESLREVIDKKKREHSEWQTKLPVLERLRTSLLSGVLFADKEFEKQDILERREFQQLKVQWADTFFKGQLAFQPNDEQLLAITELSRDCLLAARAGSGKTGVLTARAALLMGNEGVNPEEILILAFNKKAASELTLRIRKHVGAVDFSNARTFHSLAYALSPPKNKPLFDESEGGTRTKAQSKVIQSIVNEALNPVFKATLYEFFRKEAKELENVGGFMSRRDYLQYRRSQRHLTLRGDLVKSLGEKYIGDFLFEHGIKHRYEAIWYWRDEGNYQPDFTVFGNSNQRSIVIEHWGIDEHDPKRSVPEEWTTTWDQYLDTMKKKRDFWEAHNQNRPNEKVRLIETSIVDLQNGRKQFEAKLHNKLSEAGISLQRLDDKTIYERIELVHLARITLMFGRFISLAKKQGLGPNEIKRLIDAGKAGCERSQVFSELANSVYRSYESKLEELQAVDFDMLIESACHEIEAKKANCRIRLSGDRYCNLKDLRFLMIDEYQDFSPLFHKLVKAIEKHNKKLNVMCVGDDWQAINAFAGSDPYFFKTFEKSNKKAKRLSLLSNYRSAICVVDASNRFMKGKGQPAEAVSDKCGAIYAVYTDEIFIEQRATEEHSIGRKQDERFMSITRDGDILRNRDNGLVVGRILKACYSIIQDAIAFDNTVGILSRTNRISAYYRDLNMFRQKLRSCFSGVRDLKAFDKLVTVGTTHSFKGLEADRILMLQVNQGKYPYLHPDNDLFALLGVTPKKVLEEEERLFYVGITRAREKLYFLCERNRRSEFVARLIERGVPISELGIR